MHCQDRAFLTAGAARKLTLFGLLVLIPNTARAHDTWLLPHSASARPGERISLDLTSGMRFPALEATIRPDRIARASIRCAGKGAEISERKAGRKSLTLAAQTPESGIAVIWADTKPKDVELNPVQVREYLDEIGASDTIGPEWKKSESKSWREIYTKHSKTFVRVGQPENDRSWSEPVGMALEILPERDPTTLRVGDDLPVRVLLAGQPLRDFPIGFVAAGQKTGAAGKTDSEGRTSVRLGRAGWWLIKGTHLTPSAKSGTDWESHFTTLTVKVGPSR